MLVLWHEQAKTSGVRLISINRPGSSGTSKSSLPRVEQVVSDCIALLDHLSISKVAILSICAGTAFGLALAARHPERVKHQYVAVAPWVSPADCHDTKSLYKIGVAVPQGLVRGVATLIRPFRKIGMGLPSSVFEAGFMSTMSKPEQAVFQAIFRPCFVLRSTLKFLCRTS